MIKTNRIKTARMGTIKAFSGSLANIPSGFILCNGDIVNIAVYPQLHASLGTTYGAPGRLPDLRGEFLRGLDNGRGLDAGRVLGTVQTQDIKSHTHAYTRFDGAPNLGGSGTQQNPMGAIGLNTSVSGSTETRPKNLSLHYIIKT